MMKSVNRISMTMVLAFVLVSAVSASGQDLRLHRYFSDNMVLQRDKATVVRGFAPAGAEVKVSFAGQEKTSKADETGQWAVTLDPMPTNTKGQKLTVTSSRVTGNVSLNDVVVGDVIMFARQTYVDISLGRTEVGKAAAKAFKPSAAFRAIRVTTVPAKQPQDELAPDATDGWMQVDRQNALALSGAAFYFGRDLADMGDVPIGIVDVNMDRHFGIGWLSDKALDDIETMHPKENDLPWLRKNMVRLAEDRDSGKAQKELDAYWANHVSKWGENRGSKPSLGLHPLRNPMYPSAGFNAVIRPLQGIAFKGLLLQLGNDYPFIAYRDLEKAGTSTDNTELDAAWGDNYLIVKLGFRISDFTIPYVPRDWRRALGDESLPVGLILPPSSDLDVYAAHNREIRELHRRTAEAAESIGLILPGMANIPFSGQPADDKLLAERCKQWALGSVLGHKDVVVTGPMLDRVETRLSKATIFFKPGTAEGLKATGAALDTFEVAGPDREFRPAEATIEGSTIKLRSEGPVQFVRYNWSERPNQELVNRAGLPALPFSTDAGWVFDWAPPEEKVELPPEYSLTADKWGKNNVAIINGEIASMATGDSEPIPRRPGPIGIYSSPFGPNIYVISTGPGTPADGLLQPGDYIYGANGKNFNDEEGVADDQQYRDLAAAITFSESEAGEGKLVLSVRRGTKLMDVELQLQILGSYSSTTPYYCEKSETIVKNAEAWMSRRYRPESGMASEPTGFLNTDLLFLLASGTPEHQGLVRRTIYSMMEKDPLKPVTPDMSASNWGLGHDALLLGEYYHATGDPNVLPYLKNLTDRATMTQLKPEAETPEGVEAAHGEEVIGGWRHKYPTGPDRWTSGYGLLPHAGMACVMGMLYAKEAGLEVDELALERGLTHFNKGRAEYGFVLYTYSGGRRDGPFPVNPLAEANGTVGSMNGKLGMAASLFNMVNVNDSVEICARKCVYSFNNTRGGHGGMFFNNFWTPIGAWMAGEQGFKHFMKNQTWWRELYRRSDGSFNQVGRGGIGVSYALHYVAPKQRLRMLGAPKSVFGPGAPDYMKPAIEAHRKRDYARCQTLVEELLAGVLPAEDLPVVNAFLERVRTLRASVDHDLSLTERLIDEGSYHYASLELPQLKGVVAADDKRLKAIAEALESPEGKERIQAQRKIRGVEQKELDAAGKLAKVPKAKETWVGLVKSKSDKTAGDTWKLKLVETIDQAPEDWTGRRFDDSAWHDAKVPISWCMYHTALFRSTFNVEDKKAFDSLRVQGKFFQQDNVVIYLNGELVAKIDNLGRGLGETDAQLTDYALKLLRDGENTIAISSRHKRRWGAFRGTYKTAEPVDFEVQARKKD
ncbi:MAG: DUF6288 domain-containing protein [Lentisphaeria bacterium]|nr:DUF6288 domain-containing protein [Lentisphaeria bacterium]